MMRGYSKPGNFRVEDTARRKVHKGLAEVGIESFGCRLIDKIAGIRVELVAESQPIEIHIAVVQANLEPGAETEVLSDLQLIGILKGHAQ